MPFGYVYYNWQLLLQNIIYLNSFTVEWKVLRVCLYVSFFTVTLIVTNIHMGTIESNSTNIQIAVVTFNQIKGDGIDHLNIQLLNPVLSKIVLSVNQLTPVQSRTYSVDLIWHNDWSNARLGNIISELIHKRAWQAVWEHNISENI